MVPPLEAPNLRTKAAKADGLTARTYVVCDGNRIVGFYSLAAGAVLRKELPTAKARHDTPSQIPVIVIGRLAVDLRYQKGNIGSGMLREGIMRAIDASRTIGVRAVMLHAIDDDAYAFYLRYGFVPSPTDKKTLILPIETAIKAL